MVSWLSVVLLVLWGCGASSAAERGGSRGGGAGRSGGDGTERARGGSTDMRDPCPSSDVGWEELPEGPLVNGSGPPPVAVWTGDEVLVVRRELSGPSRAAAFDPCEEEWAEVSLPEGVGRLSNQLRVLDGRVLTHHTPPQQSRAQALVSDESLRSLSPAPDALLVNVLAQTGGQLAAVGYDGSRNDFAETRLVDVRGRRRQVTGSPPPARAQHGVAAFDDGVFLFGGWQNPPGTHLGDTYALSTTDASWTPLPTDGAPSPRSPLAVEHVSNAIVVWGGRDESGLKDDGAVFDLATRRWAPLPADDAPTPTDDAVITVSGGRLYVLGGHAPCHQCVGAAIRRGASYDPADGRWHPLSLPHEADRTFTRAHALDDGRLLLRHRDLTWLALYDPASGTWREIDPGPIARRANAAIAWTGRRLVVWGGVVLGRVMPNQCQNTPPGQGCDPVGPERSYPPGGAVLSL